MKRLTDRKGFTLVELCIVLGVVAIVSTMVVSCVFFLSNQNRQIQSEASRITEITQSQKTISEWIRSYDNQTYDIRPSMDQTQLTVFQGEEPKGTLSFSDGMICVNGTAKTKKFKNISSISFTKNDSETQKIIQATISFNDDAKEENQVLLFALYSGTTRDRNVMGRNG